MDKLLLMTLNTVAIYMYHLRINMKEVNPGLKNINGRKIKKY